VNAQVGGGRGCEQCRRGDEGLHTDIAGSVRKALLIVWVGSFAVRNSIKCSSQVYSADCREIAVE
jgi:hypothetical protein